jgi:two-component sensor histidine kinase
LIFRKKSAAVFSRPGPADNARVSVALMSSQELIHSVKNQLTVVIGQVEMLAREGRSEQDLERCREIKKAASNINQLLKAFLD